jgi:hypothetical protein
MDHKAENKKTQIQKTYAFDPVQPKSAMRFLKLCKKAGEMLSGPTILIK